MWGNGRLLGNYRKIPKMTYQKEQNRKEKVQGKNDGTISFLVCRKVVRPVCLAVVGWEELVVSAQTLELG